VDARSNHWIIGVLDVMLLQETQFDKAFRMSRNSFELLHSILGTFQLKSMKNNAQSPIFPGKIPAGERLYHHEPMLLHICYMLPKG
jgi:hypothetical protein